MTVTNNEIIVVNTNNKRTRSANKNINKNKNKNNNKKRKTDNDLLNNIMNDDPVNDDSGSDSVNDEICNNPLCDHKNFAKGEHTKEDNNPVIINHIMDLVNLGKTYHCKKRKTYHGINLRILSNLVGPLTELNNLVGMNKIKEGIINQIIFFLQGLNKSTKCNDCIDCDYELPCARNMNHDMLHTIITGPPGVGKTELGKILGKVYKNMGVLSKGHMNIATRSDLVGKYLGHTAIKTQEFIDKCRGGVMFLDEAYALGNNEGRDSFSKEAIDVINQNLTERRDFLCIIAGYKDALQKCFFAYNEGLARRFSFKYDITGYSGEELMEIFMLKLGKDDWKLETSEQDKIKLFFMKNRNAFPNFGGDIETLYLDCKIYHCKRVLFQDDSIKKILSYNDIESGFIMFRSNRAINKNNKSNHLNLF